MASEHDVSIVIPVYGGATTLDPLMREIEPLVAGASTPAGHSFRVAEVILAFDRGHDGSDAVCRQLAAAHPWIRVVWLSRNFGQHAATLAGIAATGGSWIVTMDEDGQHDPAQIGAMLDVALDRRAQVVYAEVTNAPPHGMLRNAASQSTKWIANHVLTSGDLPAFHSYRLILGEVGRGMAAFGGSGVYLDVALSWVNADVAHCPMAMRAGGDRRSGYGWRRLLKHFWQLVITAGTRPLRLVSVAGAVLAASGFSIAIYVLTRRVFNEVPVQGWTSVFVAVLVTGGFMMLSLGIIAEYVAVAVRMAMGRPPYLAVTDPAAGPLGPGGEAEPSASA